MRFLLGVRGTGRTEDNGVNVPGKLSIFMIRIFMIRIFTFRPSVRSRLFFRAIRAIFVFAGAHGIEDRLAPHYHAGTAAERRIVDVAKASGRIFTDIDDLHFENPVSDRTGDDRCLQKTAEEVGHDCKYRNSHVCFPVII